MHTRHAGPQPKRSNWFLIVALLVCLPVAGLAVGATEGAPDTVQTPSPRSGADAYLSRAVVPAGAPAGRPIRAAFYYPWFPEAWTQSGQRPFTNYRPSSGFYASGDPAIVSRHIRAMRYGHIDAGIASWWGQGSKTDNRISTLLRSRANKGFKWALYHEQEGYRDPVPGQIASDLAYIRNRYANDSSYLRIGGRFVVFVYADGADGCAMADRWNQGNKIGAYVVLKVFSGYRDCPNQPDGWHQYAPSSATDSQAPFSFTVSPGFWKKGEAPRLGRDLERWKRNLRAMVSSGATFQLITSFNEWGEGTSVEKASEWSKPWPRGAYLEALHVIG
jgi:Glycosyl hydrolase family 99